MGEYLRDAYAARRGQPQPEPIVDDVDETGEDDGDQDEAQS